MEKSTPEQRNDRAAREDRRDRKKTVIGWSEYLDFPDWGIAGLHCKVDTGARTSALHVENLEEIGGGRVRFDVVLSRKHANRRVTIVEKLIKRARVRSSTGEYRLRCFVKTRIALGAVSKTIEVSLVSREAMVFRMLLGRKALEHDFLVDVSRRKALGEPRHKAHPRVPGPATRATPKPTSE